MFSVIPKRSPYGLLQEDVFPNEWLTLVVCILLNQTTRKQVEKIFPEFCKRHSSPEEFINADVQQIVVLLTSLGFKNRRVRNLTEMTKAYLEGTWVHADQLPGIGTYGRQCHDMMFHGIVGNEAPKDHALVLYWNWLKFHQGRT